MAEVKDSMAGCCSSCRLVTLLTFSCAASHCLQDEGRESYLNMSHQSFVAGRLVSGVDRVALHAVAGETLVFCLYHGASPVKHVTEDGSACKQRNLGSFIEFSK